MNNWYTQAYVQSMPREPAMQTSFLSYLPTPASNPSDLDRIANLEDDLRMCRQELFAAKESLAEARTRQHVAEKGLAALSAGKATLEKIDPNSMGSGGQTLESADAAVNDHSSSSTTTVIVAENPVDLEALKKENVKLKRKLSDQVDRVKSLKKIIERYDRVLKDTVENFRSSRKEFGSLIKMVDEFTFVDSDDEDGSIIFNEGPSFGSEDLAESSDMSSNMPKGFLDAIAKISDEDLAEIRNMDMILP